MSSGQNKELVPSSAGMAMILLFPIVRLIRGDIRLPVWIMAVYFPTYHILLDAISPENEVLRVLFVVFSLLSKLIYKLASTSSTTNTFILGFLPSAQMFNASIARSRGRVCETSFFKSRSPPLIQAIAGGQVSR